MLANRVEQTSTTTGTGTYSLTGTVADRVTFVTGIGTAKQCYYLAVDNTNGGWEIGIGTVTDLATDTLSRDTVIGSSNGGLAVNWAAGTRNLMVVAPAELFGPMGGRLLKGTVGGTANAITVTSPVPLRALTNGAWAMFDATADNTGTVTLNVDSLGASALKDATGADLAVGAIKNGQTCLAVYKSSTGFWHLLSAVPQSTVNVQTFSGNGTWTKPAGTPKKVLVQAWAAGGSGGSTNNATGSGGGGGGGAYVEFMFEAADLSATEAVTVGVGGAGVGSGNGNVGGNTTFGSKLTAYGGAAGAGSATTTGNGGGGGGGALSASETAASGLTAGHGGRPWAADPESSTEHNPGWGGGSGGDGGNANVGLSGRDGASGGAGGGGGGDVNFNGGKGGDSIYGGAGGGGGSVGTGAGGAGGVSKFGGAGGAGSNGVTATSGSVPGGGGGGAGGNSGVSGAGGNGKMIVTTFY